MKISQIKEVLNSIFEEDDSLKYALATNLAKYGRPQSKPSDKPAKLTKGLEKKREKAVKDLKKSMSEDKGRDMAREFISKMRNAMRYLNDDELDTFRKDIALALDLNVNESINEDEGTLNKIADMLDRKFPDLRFDVNKIADRIDVRGSQQDMYNFGTELSGEKIFDYEVWHTDDDDRGEIVRIVKSDSIYRGGVNEEQTYSGFMRSKPDPDSEPFEPTGSVSQFQEDLRALFGKFKDVLKNPEFIKGVAQIMVNWKSLLRSQLDEEPKKKADRCLRIARRKIPQSSAYRSGLIVKCRKGMIWKKEK